MGVLPATLLLAQLNMKETTQKTIMINSQNESIWKQTSTMEEEDHQEAISKAKSAKTTFNKIRRGNNSLMKKRRSRSTSARLIEKRVSTLRYLVPNTNHDGDNNNDGDSSVGSIEQLFTQTADYILSLQTTVRLMKTLVDVLSGSSSSSNDHE